MCLRGPTQTEKSEETIDWNDQPYWTTAMVPLTPTRYFNRLCAECQGSALFHGKRDLMIRLD
ncbi:MAG: hypothetical protein MI923_19315 [Phycisphaerales bacterium]|nr:hypothetical protein [Phycisphaerales bacterium]